MNPVNPTRIGVPAMGTPERSSPARADPLAPSFATSLERLLDKRAATPPPAPGAEAPTGGVRFSRHAESRIQSRGVAIGAAEREELSTALDRLSERGAKEALVLLDDNAYVVGVAARTVITVMPRADALGTVFTQIDATYVAR